MTVADEINNADAVFMAEAIGLAEAAGKAGEVPVGCVVVFEGRVIARAYNTVESAGSCLGHAEMNALREAIIHAGYKHLPECTLYVTLEPCAMCAGAIVLSRIERVVIAAEDPKAGAAGSIFQILDDSRLNHRCRVELGLMRDESSRLLKDFFIELRKKRKTG